MSPNIDGATGYQSWNIWWDTEMEMEVDNFEPCESEGVCKGKHRIIFEYRELRRQQSFDKHKCFSQEKTRLVYRYKEPTEVAVLESNVSSIVPPRTLWQTLYTFTHCSISFLLFIPIVYYNLGKVSASTDGTGQVLLHALLPALLNWIERQTLI